MWTSVISTLLAVAGALGSDDLEQKHYVYVATESDDYVNLVEFDPNEKQATVAQRIQVGYQPTEIEGPHGLTVSPDGKHWFVSMAHGKPFGTLYKYETGTNELVGQCELGLFPATMQISDATGLLYCVNFDLHGDMTPSSVSIVDPDEMVEVARTTTGSMPHGSRISPDGLKHYSCAMMSDELFEIDTVTFEIARTLQLTSGLGSVRSKDHGKGGHADAKPTWVHPHPTNGKLYVALNGAAQVVEVDAKRWKIVRRFPTAKGPYNIEVSPDGKRMLVTYKSSKAIGVWDLQKGKEIVRLESSRRVPHGVTVSKDSRYAFVSCEAVGSEKGTLDVIDLRSNELVTTVELGLQAGGICYWKAE